MILTGVKCLIRKGSILSEIKLIGALRFLAEGGNQRSEGKDFNVAMGRSTVSKVITEVLVILERKLFIYFFISFLIRIVIKTKQSFKLKIIE